MLVTMSSMTGSELSALAEVLGALIDDREDAKAVLERVDFPVGKIPALVVPARFWYAVLGEARKGLSVGGPEAIARVVAATYRHPALARYLPDTAGTPEPEVTSSSLSSKAFVRRFVVQVHQGVGVGLLLSPRVIATCRHVVKSEPWSASAEVGVVSDVKVSRDGATESAKVMALERRTMYDDVALLVLKEPLGPDAGPFPALVSGMDDSAFHRLKRMLDRREEPLRIGGVAHSGRKLSSAYLEIGEIDVDLGYVDWYQLRGSTPKGRSGGPLWLVPPRSAGAPTWSPGVVLGLVAQGANQAGGGGPPHSFGVTSDSLLELRRRLREAPGASDAVAALSSIRTVDATAVVEAYERRTR